MAVKQIAPELERIVAMGQEIEELGSGFGGAMDPPRGLCGGKKGATSSSAIYTIIGG